MNNKGFTLMEVIIASIILILFITAFYKIFFKTEKFERISETHFNAYNLASGVMNNLSRYQGTGFGREASFNTRADVGDIFEPGITHNLENIDGRVGGLAGFVVNPSDYVLKGSIAPVLEYEIKDYTTSANNTYTPTEGIGQKDGFRMVKVRVAWEDQALEHL